MAQQVAVPANHVRDVSQAAAETGAIARNGLDPAQPVIWNKGGDYFYQYDSPTSLNPPKEFYDETLAARVKEDEKREAEKGKVPRPTSANTPPPELIPEDKTAIAICLSPDVCRSPEKPVPYPTWGRASDSQNYSPDVRSNGKVIKRQDSVFFCCYGDEAGIGLGVKSNTIGDIVEPVTSSGIVRINGIWAQRHDDRCTLNSGNTVGEYSNSQCVDTHKAPDATDNQDGSSDAATDTRGNGEKFLDGFTDNAGETWDGLKQVGSDLWDGTKDLASDLYNDPGGTLSAGAENVRDGVTGAAEWTGEVAQNLYDDPGATIGRGADNVANTASSIWHAVADPYADAYAEGGLAQAAGHGTFDVVKLAVEALATKGAATAAGKAATIGAGAAAKIHRVEEAVETVSDARKIKPDATGGHLGTRSTRTAKWVRKDVNGRRVYQRDDLIDPKRVDDRGRTNKQRMEKGLAPIGDDGKEINLHHMTQDEPGAMAEVKSSFHSENDRQLHIYSNQYDKMYRDSGGNWHRYSSAPPSMDRGPFNKWKSEYWQIRANDF